MNDLLGTWEADVGVSSKDWACPPKTGTLEGAFLHTSKDEGKIIWYAVYQAGMLTIFNALLGFSFCALDSF